MSDNSEQTSSRQSECENTCVVCFKTTLIYSIGSCNHPVCFECSARMRCLCLQNECPICRQDLPKVIFTKTIDQFSTLDRNTRTGLFEKKYRIIFTDYEIQKAFYHLLENRCPKCDEHKPFVDFHKLKEHVRKIHEHFYCEICTENLKIFSSERRCYSRSGLAQHRRIGDSDDTSHRGHPRCDYCELRYLDKDELFRHLRREHYFCHLCDADGINLFYGTVLEMRDHFKAEHFICEEDECIEEEFTVVFRTEIDLRAHKATVHSKNMSRFEARQTRTIDLDISYGPRGRGGGGGHERGGGGHDHPRGGRIRTHDTQREFDVHAEPQMPPPQAPIQIDSKSEEQFPSLGPSASSAASGVQLANSIRHVVYGQSGLARTKENFPALGGMGMENNTRNLPTSSKQNVTSKQSKPTTASSLFRSSAGSSKASQQQRQQPLASSSAKAMGYKKDSISEFPSLPSNSSKKGRNDLLMEDLILPERNNIEKTTISSKHRALVNDYVSIASQMTKVNLIKQKDETISGDQPKNVPQLNSINNFPSLGGSSGGNNSKSPQWLTVKPNHNHNSSNNNNQKLKVENSVKNINKKLNEVPQQKNQKSNNPNGITKKPNDENKKANKEKNENKSKEVNNKAKEIRSLSEQQIIQATNAKAPPPGFKKLEPVTHVYVPLPGASKRNQALVGEFQQVLKDNETMQEFRVLSQMFRDGNYFARSYYESCKGVLGEKFDSIFPELLVLLPDIEKQQKLYRIYTEEMSNSEETVSKKKNKKQKLLEACATCQQVVLSKDLTPHVQSHALENNFPTLKGDGLSGKLKK